ncbi:MAG TPA: hypothetical protein VEG27_13155 [Usitatibacter sp.]|nr:hypothetical protein [Usitatibacter sp.]
MPKKSPAIFSADLVPLSQPLPTALAASIGATLARHAYLDWVLGQVMYSLMEISIRQGRVILKLPRPRQYIAAVRDLFDFHAVRSDFNFEQLARRLEVAERARALLTRSTYMRDTAAPRLRIQLARALWDPGPGGESQPESQVVDRRFLAARRREVEAAIAAAERLRALTNGELRKLHELRRRRPRLDRRKG